MCVTSILSSLSQTPSRLSRESVVKVSAYLLGSQNKSLFYSFNEEKDSFAVGIYFDASLKSPGSSYPGFQKTAVDMSKY